MFHRYRRHVGIVMLNSVGLRENDDDDVNSMSYQYRRHCDVDNIDSTMGTGYEWICCGRWS